MVNTSAHGLIFNKLKVQKGVVLIVALVFLIALTAVVSVLMKNTTVDIKTSGANQDKMMAIQEAIGAVDEVIFKQVNKLEDVNHFTHEAAQYPLNITVTGDNLQATISFRDVSLNPITDPIIDCPHVKQNASIEMIRCNHLNIQISKYYGRNNNQQVIVHAGISQQLLTTCSTEMCHESESENKANLKTMRTYLYVEEAS